MKNRQELLDLINKKITEVQTDKLNPDKKEANASEKPKRKPATRAAINRENGSKGKGPVTEEGKARASANSLKHGYYAHIEKLNPHDSASYIQLAGELRSALHPDGPAEEHLIKELAMLNARLKRLEAAEFALLMGNIEGTPPKEPAPGRNGETIIHDQVFDPNYDDPDVLQPDARALAAAYQNSLDTIERLHKIEVHLRRAYKTTWDRLERMQRERLKMPLDEMLKRTQAWLTAEAKRTNRPQDIPSSHPDLNEKGKFPTYEKGDPMYRPKNDDEDDYPNKFS